MYNVRKYSGRCVRRRKDEARKKCSIRISIIRNNGSNFPAFFRIILCPLSLSLSLPPSLSLSPLSPLCLPCCIYQRRSTNYKLQIMFALSIIYLGFYTVTRNIGFKIVILLVIIDDYIVANYWPHFVALKFIS